MNKIIIGLLVVAGIGLLAWLVLAPGDVVMEQEYVIDDEVAELESELQAVEADLAAGVLTPQEAAASQARISSRLEAIANVSTQAQASASLTQAQRAQLLDGLNRLQNILVTYQSTLQVVDELVLTLPEAERPQLFRGRTSVREAIEVAAAEVDAAAGGTTQEVEVGGEVETETEVNTTIPDATEIDIVDEDDEGMATSTETQLQGEVELEAATNTY